MKETEIFSDKRVKEFRVSGNKVTGIQDPKLEIAGGQCESDTYYEHKVSLRIIKCISSKYELMTLTNVLI